jgi:hypothetical protein
MYYPNRMGDPAAHGASTSSSQPEILRILGRIVTQKLSITSCTIYNIKTVPQEWSTKTISTTTGKIYNIKIPPQLGTPS